MADEVKKDVVLAAPVPQPVPPAPVAPQPPAMTQSDYLAMSESFGNIQTDKRQQAVLFGPVDEDDVEIRPDGLVYLPWMGYVTRLRDAFGTSWGLLPQGKPVTRDGFVIWAFYLCIQGRMAAYAIGECEQTARMTWGECVEGAKSNALMRLCKNMGISLELWQPSFIRNWKNKYAVCDVPNPKKPGEFLWRRKGSSGPPMELLLMTPKADPPPAPMTPSEVAAVFLKPAESPVVDGAAAALAKVFPGAIVRPPVEYKPVEPPTVAASVPSQPEPAAKAPEPDPHDSPVPGINGGVDTVKVESVSIHRPGPRARAKNPSYRVLSTNQKTYYTFDKTMATVANEAKKSGVVIRVEYEVTPYGFKILTLSSGPFDQPLPLPGVGGVNAV